MFYAFSICLLVFCVLGKKPAMMPRSGRKALTWKMNSTLVLVDIPASEIQHEKKVYTTIPLGLILADGAIITICSEDTPILNRFIKSHVRNFSTKKRTRFVYQILLNSMTTYQNVLRSVDNRRLAIEARIGEEKEDEADLVGIVRTVGGEIVSAVFPEIVGGSDGGVCLQLEARRRVLHHHVHHASCRITLHIGGERL